MVEAIAAIVIAKMANLFNDNEIKIRQDMSFFAKVYRNFTSVLLLSTLGLLVVPESYYLNSLVVDPTYNISI